MTVECSEGEWITSIYNTLKQHWEEKTDLKHDATSIQIFKLCTGVWHISEVTQSCLTLRDPMDCSLPCSSIHGIFQARVLQWVAIFFSRGVFLTQGSNPGLPHCRQTLYRLSHQGSPLTQKVFMKNIVKLINTALVAISCSVMSDSFWPHSLGLTRLFCPWDSPGKNTGVGCHFLL